MLEVALSVFQDAIFESIISKPIFQSHIHQFLIYPKYLSKYGDCDLHQRKLSKFPKEKMKIVWDLLPDDEEFQKQKTIFQEFESYFSGVRFQDPGVGLFLKENYPKMELELNVERFSHNINSIVSWQEFFSPNLKKIVLSNLTPLNKIKEWRPKILKKIEILGVGRLEIFYSPRHLLAEHSQKNVLIESEDRLGSFHHFVQNHSGTIMYNSKDICVLSYLEEIQQNKIDAVRLDVSNLKQLLCVEQALASDEGLSALAQLWPSEKLVGFFRANKTNAQFSMLKNKNLRPKNKELQKIGRVVESKKGEYSLLELCESVETPCAVAIYCPEKKVIKLELNYLENIQKKKITTSGEGYYFTGYIPKATPNSLIYKNAEHT
jgi:putative protease